VDKDEVNAFLLTLSQQWERMQEENKDLRLKLEAATKELQKMRDVESSLYRTLKTAEDTGSNMIEQANKEAGLKVLEAQLKSEQLLNDARLKARSLIEDAYSQSEKAVVEMQHEVKALEQEHQRMENYLDNLVRDLKNLATDALDKVEKNAAKPRPSLSSILAKAANIKVRRTELDRVFQDVPSAVTMPATEKRSDSIFVDKPVKAEMPMEPIQPVQPIQPEIPNPVTPVPDYPSPEIEQPRPDYPDISPDRIEQPIPDIQPIQPDVPEIQPPMTQPGTYGQNKPVKEKTLAGGSFFDTFE